MRYFYSYEDERVFSLCDIHAIWNSFTAEEKAEYNNSINAFIRGGLEYGLEEMTDLTFENLKDEGIFFYEITDDTYEGNKQIHLFSNLYFHDLKDGYEVAEWQGSYLTFDELKTIYDFSEYTCEHISYISDILSEEEAQKYFLAYIHQAKQLNIKKVTEDTPCGLYWF